MDKVCEDRTCVNIKVDESEVLHFRLPFFPVVTVYLISYFAQTYIHESKTCICVPVISILALGWAVNRNEDSAIAVKSAIMHDERKADELFILDAMVCMVGDGESMKVVGQARVRIDTSPTLFGA